MTNDLLLRIVWPMLWQSAFLAAVVVGLTLLLRNRLEPRWRYLLWTIVLLRLALPVLPSSPVGILLAKWPVASDQWRVEETKTFDPATNPLLPATAPTSGIPAFPPDFNGEWRVAGEINHEE